MPTVETVHFKDRRGYPLCGAIGGEAVWGKPGVTCKDCHVMMSGGPAPSTANPGPVDGDPNLCWCLRESDTIGNPFTSDGTILVEAHRFDRRLCSGEAPLTFFAPRLVNTCASCGRADHRFVDCVTPVERAIVGHLCTHPDGSATVVRDGYQCVEDEAIYEGDTLTTTVRYTTRGGLGRASIMTAATTAHLTPCCRAEHEGRTCTLEAGHRTMFNHHDPNTGQHWRVQPNEENP